jgi:CubicO group peptidase (beta-lactamase class C family)
VERGLVGLDDSVFEMLPELAKLQIISSPDEGKTLLYTKPTKQITLRHLLTHSSGLGYDMISPLLMTWRAEKGQESMGYPISGTVPECFSMPLLFEPGEGWVYGPGLDWAGYLIKRLDGNISLEEYFVENIFKPIGRTAPFPTFDIAKHPEIKARLVITGERQADGSLKPTIAPYGENPKDEHGGTALALTVPDYTAVLADLVSDTPKLLKPETITAMFTPQFLPESAAYKGLHALSFIWEPMTGGIWPREHGVNHGIGGLLITKGIPELKLPAYTLTWSGFTNPVWMVNLNKGVGGFFATQIVPPGDPKVCELIAAFWKDFWSEV